MKNKYFLTFFLILLNFFLFINTKHSYSQSVNLFPDFSPEEKADIAKAFGTFTSATAVFTGRNSVSTGNFQFENDGGEFSVTSIPLTHVFGEDGDALRYSIRGALGHFSSTSSVSDFSNLYSEIESQLPPQFQGLPNQPDFRKDSAMSLSLGSGIIYEPVKNLRLMPSFDFIWTHVKRRFDYNNFVSSLLGLQLDRDIFNNSTESITYSPSMGVDYKFDLGDGYSITPSVLYTYLRTADIWSKSQYANFAINADVLQTKLEANIPLGCSFLGCDTSLRPFATRTGLFAAVRNSLDENQIFDFGADFLFDTTGFWVDKIIFGAAYITASDFDGYRVNLGFDF